MSDKPSFFAELKRRDAIRMAGLPALPVAVEIAGCW
jgi:hypothetical protein